MTSVLVEACVSAPAEAALVSRIGAHRLEICRDLHTGGLTPGADLVRAVQEQTDLPLMAMVRPRPGHFRVSALEVSMMLREIESLASLGVGGIVVGVLDDSGEIDLDALGELVAAAGVPVTFHRAFDEVRDPLRSLEVLREAGIARVLTSGGAATAWEGRGVLSELVSEAGEDLVVLGGGTVRADHVESLVEETGLREVHARASAVPGILEALGTRPRPGEQTIVPCSRSSRLPGNGAGQP